MGNLQYPIVLEDISFAYEPGKEIFKDISLKLPGGVVSLVGQNGSGKSTLLLLAGDRLKPQKGTVLIDGIDSITITYEEKRNKLVSFIYQNMEFETEDSIGELLTIIYEKGFHREKNPQLLKTVIDILDLNEILKKKTGDISKGEMQRTVIAFSLLYGSKIIMMDEPVFALENNKKALILAYLNEYAKEFNVTIYYSIHEIELSRQYSEWVLLFTKAGKILVGKTEDLLTKENIEEAYQVPMDMLHQREHLYRDHLLRDKSTELKGLNTKVYD